MRIEYYAQKNLLFQLHSNKLFKKYMINITRVIDGYYNNYNVRIIINKCKVLEALRR